VNPEIFKEPFYGLTVTIYFPHDWITDEMRDWMRLHPFYLDRWWDASRWTIWCRVM
jgi:hypothetical protein